MGRLLRMSRSALYKYSQIGRRPPHHHPQKKNKKGGENDSLSQQPFYMDRTVLSAPRLPALGTLTSEASEYTDRMYLFLPMIPPAYTEKARSNRIRAEKRSLGNGVREDKIIQPISFV